MREWTFITNHAAVLSLIARQPRITGRELSTNVGITERAIRKIIADLYATGYIAKKREGRSTRYRIKPGLRLRHNTHREVIIGDFLQALGWKQNRKRARVQKTESRVNPN